MVAGRRETPHLPPDRDFYGQTLIKSRAVCDAEAHAGKLNDFVKGAL